MFVQDGYLYLIVTRHKLTMHVKRKITLVAIFWEALRHICVTAGA
jgi:hypothetical protein